MKRALLFLGIAWLCGTAQVLAAGSRPRPVPPPPGDTTLTIRAVSGLQYDVVRFAVRPGTRIKIILRNADDMAHNLVLTRPAKRLDVVNAALALGDKGPAASYVPKSADVLAAIAVLSPAQEGELVWTAPATEGVFPYVCTYPGHGFVMFGALYVTTKPLPPLKDDPNVPEQALAQQTPPSHHVGYTDSRPSPHPYPVELPVVYRTFMPDAGPAAIVVMLPNEQSYCWDAGTCRLRYAWRGYVDNAEHWHGNGKRLSKSVGDVYFRDQAGFPFHLGSPNRQPAAVQFKGYQVVDRYPHFRYLVDGVEVVEVIRAAETGNGLIREFRVGPVSGDVYFSVHPQDGMEYVPSASAFEGSTLHLTPEQARHFTILMKPQKTEKL
ncbi:MAG: hypothetical protein ICV83_12520 [Cytophagales bacterium]|nr:hypothetical protein [Cytophagales bacterium]